MANKNLFQSFIGSMFRRATARNEAGGIAYARSTKQALAQYIATGTIAGTYYATADTHLEATLRLCGDVDLEFVARAAIYSRKNALMKDVPALLVALLTVKAPQLVTNKLFDQVIDSPKMLRNFVQIIRSGVVGRKSLGSKPKRLVERFLESRTDEQLFIGSIGNAPSLADIVKMVHPRPTTKSREALYAWLTDNKYDEADLPEIVRCFERIKRQTVRGREPVPDVPMQMLTSLPLTKEDWKQIARNASWQTTRMNLSTLERHGVFEDREMVTMVANRLRNSRLIEQSRVFPYQLLAAQLNVADAVPNEIKEALAAAMELAISNVPRVKGKVFVLVDVSGSMHSPITGYQATTSSKIRCVDVAALMAAAIVRRNPSAEVIPFADAVYSVTLKGSDSVLASTKRLTSLPAGGTNCSLPLAQLNERQAKGDLVIYLSDNQSWIETMTRTSGGQTTATMREWMRFQKRSPKAKLICIDLVPGQTTQAQERENVFNLGGFSDHVFTLVADIAEDRMSSDHFVREIERISLE